MSNKQMLHTPKSVLILAPHPDDGEFGCGATVAKWIERGAEAFYVAFSPCEESLPKGFAKEDIASELFAATSKLGIQKKNVTLHDFPVRHFPEHRQEILEILVAFKKEHGPEVILLPCSTDIHQDHQVIFMEGRRAFKESTLLGYELPWNSWSFSASALSAVDETHLAKKMEALSCYASQQTRPYFKNDFVRSLATVRGTQIGQTYAEAFEVVRAIID
jgi:LmbE family N-acetylglucosaminyl deacetylase